MPVDPAAEARVTLTTRADPEAADASVRPGDEAEAFDGAAADGTGLGAVTTTLAGAPASPTATAARLPRTVAAYGHLCRGKRGLSSRCQTPLDRFLGAQVHRAGTIRVRFGGRPSR